MYRGPLLMHHQRAGPKQASCSALQATLASRRPWNRTRTGYPAVLRRRLGAQCSTHALSAHHSPAGAARRRSSSRVSCSHQCMFSPPSIGPRRWGESRPLAHAYYLRYAAVDGPSGGCRTTCRRADMLSLLRTSALATVLLLGPLGTRHVASRHRQSALRGKEW